MIFNHRSVLLDEAVKALVWDPDGIYIDGTFGRGGHSQLILKNLSPYGRLIAIDRDPEAVQSAQSWQDSRFKIYHSKFSKLDRILIQEGYKNFSGILLDLGVSSPQLDDPTRGFSFRHHGPLDMRMDCSKGMKAVDWLASASEQEIREVIFAYGEERHAKKIAHAIILKRQQNFISNTLELANIVASVVRRRSHRHPATKTFQGIRIHINQELYELEKCLGISLDALTLSGRLVVLSFHSLEDRMIKSFIRGSRQRNFFFLKEIEKLRVSLEEKKLNARARSGIMRVAEKTSISTM